MYAAWTPTPFPPSARRFAKQLGRGVVLCFLSTTVLLRSFASFASPRPVSDPSLTQITVIVNDLMSQLGMTAAVGVMRVPSNDKMVSVERIPGELGQNGTFQICFDQNFLASLDEQELRAAVAHELGHIWIFSHHPYLQTEALANQIAMRVVSRDSLKKIYDKLWSHLGVAGNLDEFLGTARHEK